jgi:hypothetical protein
MQDLAHDDEENKTGPASTKKVKVKKVAQKTVATTKDSDTKFIDAVCARLYKRGEALIKSVKKKNTEEFKRVYTFKP